jgi:hypothetical protein
LAVQQVVSEPSSLERPQSLEPMEHPDGGAARLEDGAAESLEFAVF